jgi:hypothetical protein
MGLSSILIAIPCCGYSIEILWIYNHGFSGINMNSIESWISLLFCSTRASTVTKNTSIWSSAFEFSNFECFCCRRFCQ